MKRIEFKMNTAFFFLVIAFSRAFSTDIPSNPLSDDFIDYINSQQSTWRAGKNFDESTPTLHIRSLLGSRTSPKAKSLKTRVHSEDVEIPESFDARENWPECEIIRVIKDQSACGSCWAVSATSVMSDRICIHSNGKKQTYVSDEDLLSCCLVCGMGCSGGDPSLAWYYWNVHGISSGGPYNSTTGCKAYSLSPCGHHAPEKIPECPENDYDTPECMEQCDPQSPLDYESDKSYGQESYTVSSEVTQIQLEIMRNGPIVGTFDVYEDFLSYKSGVYQHVVGKALAGHAVRILGWGVEKGTPYWLVANSWNENWGDKGSFKIIRGKNECGIEFAINVALPKLTKSDS
ncbi:cathepsin B isoform X2 [Leptinotarsa decemlineata]|uniref:cathepsin B isoform X2 n=1 Tax=Leptinotarsa decemlineata TaxID=7539 RepID=UPI003D3048B1